jgi:hypothetical protein
MDEFIRDWTMRFRAKGGEVRVRLAANGFDSTLLSFSGEEDV